MIAIGEVVHQDDETMLGFFSRVASDHRMSLRQFCEYKGTTPERLCSGNITAVERVTEQWKIDPSDVIARMPVRKAAFYRLGSDRNLHRGFNWRSFRYCPQCIANDLASGNGKLRTRPYHRSAWLSPYVFQCVGHHLDLVPSAEQGHGFGDFAGAILPILDGVGEIAAASVCRELDLASRYFDGREKEVVMDGGVLDNMVTFAAAEACEAFGSLALGVTGAVPRRTLSAGFRILSMGEDAIVPFLDGRIDAPFSGRRRSATDVYGAVYTLLRMRTGSTAHYAPVRDMVVSHALRNLPLGKGERFLGAAVGSREFHTVHSAALEYGISDRHMVSLLKRHNLLGSEDDYSGRRFDVATIDSLLSGRSHERVSLADLRARTGLTTAMVAKLAENGTLVASGPTSKSEFGAREVDAFLTALFGRARRGLPRDAVSIGAAASMTSTPKHEIVIAIIEGRLPAYSGRAVARTIGAIKVSHADVSNLGRGTRHPACERLSVRKTGERMRVGEQTLKALFAAGHLTCVEGPGRARYVQIDDINAFMQRHIPLSEIQRLTNGKMATLRSWLADQGIIPLIEGGEGKAGTFYARADVMSRVEARALVR